MRTMLGDLIVPVGETLLILIKMQGYVNSLGLFIQNHLLGLHLFRLGTAYVKISLS